MPPKRITIEERNARAAAAAAVAAAPRAPAVARRTGRAAPAEQPFVTRDEFSRAFTGVEAMLQQLLDRREPPAAENQPVPEADNIDDFMDFGNLGAGALGPAAPPPFRSQHGECPSIEERFAFLDEKVLTAAMAGRLSPEKLPLLIPPTAEIYRENANDPSDRLVLSLDPETRQFFAAPPRNSTGQIAERFKAAIPNLGVFLYAWGNLIDLMIHGCGEPEAAPEIYTALWSHAQWIIDNSVHFTWDSIVRYHLKVASKRFASDFHTSLWYDAYDAAAGNVLIRKDSVMRQADRSERQGATTAKPSRAAANPTEEEPAKKRKKQTSAATASTERCVKFHVSGCTEPCPSGRKHECSNCGKHHRVFDCPGKGKAQ